MDEISRELPPDTTTPETVRERAKGPEELVLADRGIVREDLVVNDSRSDNTPPEPEPVHPALLRRFEALPVPAEAPAGEAPAAEAPAAAAEEVVTELPAELPIGPAADAPVEDEVDAAAAAAAVAEEAEVAEVEEELLGDEEGLPPVPELTAAAAVARVVYVLMLTSREGLSLLRLAQACNTTQKLVEQALDLLQQQLRDLGLPVELARTGDSVRWMSGVDAFPYLQRLRGVKKLEKLSPAALETLAVIAYRQPVMRSEIEAIRGVKAGPMLRTLLQHKLVRMTGRAEVPGRPLQYGTTQQFLERFGIKSLDELPRQQELKSLG